VKQLAEQIKRSLGPSGVPTGRKLEKKANIISTTARRIGATRVAQDVSRPIGSIDDVIVIGPADTEPVEARFGDAGSEWLNKPSALYTSPAKPTAVDGAGWEWAEGEAPDAA
jgi:hypothetical protein